MMLIKSEMHFLFKAGDNPGCPGTNTVDWLALNSNRSACSCLFLSVGIKCATTSGLGMLFKRVSTRGIMMQN